MDKLHNFCHKNQMGNSTITISVFDFTRILSVSKVNSKNRVLYDQIMNTSPYQMNFGIEDNYITITDVYHSNTSPFQLKYALLLIGDTISAKMKLDKLIYNNLCEILLNEETTTY